MSDYWVSKKKYFCKYCDIFIADDAPSRKQHEEGLRHKGNKDRFIRDLYKQGEKKKKEKAEEDREMKAIDAAESSTAGSSTPAKRERSPTPEDPEDTRRFKVRQKTVAVGLGGDLYDPGEIRIKKREDGTKIIRPKVEEATNATPVPQWKPTQWRRGGDPTANGEEVRQEESSEAQVKREPLVEPGPVENAEASKTEPLAAGQRIPSPDDIKPEPQDVKPVVDAPSSAGPSLFKKRKVKSSTAGGRKPI
ncbi:hypothetical protein FRC01_002759 [Tulasnella sp. 417]|nr:hypothetical protein FRC01_002759 [Tulasnella sp. 417]